MNLAAQDEHWMGQAIALSRQALYVTSPNPRVGCVMVRDGQVLGSGVTQAAGGAHAEVMALRDAARRGVEVAGATFYVTLEPCSHHGRTPPCVDAILAARAARVVVAMRDPNPLVAGRGLAQLRAAGVQVRTGVCTQQALAVNPGFIARMTRGTPWVWVKSAASLDGQTALPDGESKWITGQEARQDGQHWRARSCVVLTGMGTVLADNPRLNVRDVPTPRQPLRAVIDSRLRMPLDAAMLDGGPVWLFTTQGAAGRQAEKIAQLTQRGVRVIAMPELAQAVVSDRGAGTGADTGADTATTRSPIHPPRVHLPSVLQWLGQHDVNEVHVEAGATLGGALLQADCVDALLVYLAPRLLGQGRGMFALPALSSLCADLNAGNGDKPGDGRQFEYVDVARVGADLRLYAHRPQRWQALLETVGGGVEGRD